MRHVLLTLTLMMAVLFSASRADAYAFIYDCGANWSKLPVQYTINKNGSKYFPDIATIESIFKASFEAWEEPCCSNFRSQYDGLTTLTADRNQGKIVLSFAEDSFPREYGGSETIAVTLMNFYQNCTIQQAPILFNGFNHQFRNDGRNVDLQSVATHEVGHLLGLDHSNLNRATMYYAYTGGTSARQLHDDDIQGVCALYPRVCSCSKDSECPNEEQCIGGQCEKVPCTADNQCATDLVCRNGDCVVPPCSADSECAPGFQCSNQVCVSVCPSCRTCTTQSDCGGNGHCVDYGNGDTKCMVMCAQGGLCPGDSLCFQVPTDNQTLYICLNPDAQNAGLCPDSYSCKEPVKKDDPCDGVSCPTGQSCKKGICEANSNTNGPDAGSPNPGNSGNNNPDAGNNDDDDDEVTIITDSGRKSSDCSAVSINDSSSPTSLLALLLAGGLFSLRMRRHRQNR